VYCHENGSAYRKHDEQPLGDVGWFVDLQFHHRYLKYLIEICLQVFMVIVAFCVEGASLLDTVQHPRRLDSSTISRILGCDFWVTLKTEAVYAAYMLVPTYQTAALHKPEEQIGLRI
jgi:hypothetical protein